MNFDTNSDAKFIEFLNMFERKGRFYTPKDPSHNVLRHFGERTKEGLLLRHEEILYLYDKNQSPVDLKTRMYFDLKNSEYNVLFSRTDRAKIYNKRKHFNREKDKEIGLFDRCKKEDCFKDKAQEYANENLLGRKLIVAVEGWCDYCLIEVEPVAVPSKDLDDKNLLK